MLLSRYHPEKQRQIGQWRERLVMLNTVMSLVLTLGVMVVLWYQSLVFPRPDGRIVVGKSTQFPSGSVTEIVLESTFVDTLAPGVQQRMTVSQIPVYIVHDSAEGFIALYNRDGNSGCQVAWVERESLFIDPCYGSIYTRSGTLNRGSAPRELDRFGITTNDQGAIVIDITTFQSGTSFR